MPKTELEYIEINPETKAQKTIIVLHGLGADGHDFTSIVTELNLPSELGVRFIFPHAPIKAITINNGYQMRAWYDIISWSIDHHFDEQGIAESGGLIHALIEKEQQRGILSKNIILAGFSQGAVMALQVGLRYPEPLGGILALSGYLPMAEKTLQQAAAANRTIPIFLAHGTLDPIVPYILGEAALHALKTAHYNVAWYPYPIPHTVSAAEISDIRTWLLSLGSV